MNTDSYTYIYRNIHIFTHVVLTCLWGVFVWGFGVLFWLCVCVCVGDGGVILCRCVCVCVCVCDLFIFLHIYCAPQARPSYAGG